MHRPIPALCGLLAVVAVRILAGPAEPLTTEEVVRLWVSGTPVEDVIDGIQARDVAFDLSPEMVDELRAVGLPEELLRAMRERQAAIVGERSTVDEPLEAFRVLLNVKQKKPKNRRLRVFDEIDRQLLDLWRLPGPDTPRFTDVAVFLACSTADHVPDRWRSKTPLVWESPQMPRHRMLAMHAGAIWGEATLLNRVGLGGPKIPTNEDGTPARVAAPPDAGLGMLVLEVPFFLEAQLTPGVAHDLHLGIALEVGGRYYPWTIAALQGVVLEDGSLELEARIHGLSKPGIDALDIEFANQDQRKYRARTICARGCPVSR